MLWERIFILLNIFSLSLLTCAALTTVGLLYVLGKIFRQIKGRYHVLITDEGPEIHTAWPDLQAITLEGGSLDSGGFAGQEFALLLVSPDCAPCHALLAAVEPVRRHRVEPISFVVVVEGGADQAREFVRRYRLQAVVLPDPEGAIRVQLGVSRTPHGFLVDSSGIIRMKGVVNNRNQLEALVSRRGRAIGALQWESVTGSGDEMSAGVAV